MGIFGTLFDIGKDVVTIATAPVEIALAPVKAITKEVASVASEVVEDVKSDLESED